MRVNLGAAKLVAQHGGWTDTLAGIENLVGSALGDTMFGSTEANLLDGAAGAGGAAHLPGMAASMTSLPVFGVPIENGALRGLDALLSIVQMPGGVPVGTLAIGKPGAINAALLAASVLGLADARIREALRARRARITADVMADRDPRREKA